MKCWRVIAHDHNAAQAVGQRSHIIQVEAIGQFKSKAAFARGLVAAGLFATERSALSQMNHSGGETWNEYSREITSAAPETVFVGPLNKISTDVFIPWPAP